LQAAQRHKGGKGKTTINLAAAAMRCRTRRSNTQAAQGKNDAKTRKL